MKKKYTNINYNILYFNFIEHKIPEDSNIINIVLNSTNLYDSNDLYESSVVDNFRRYCGEILTELFVTKLDLLWGNEDFFNT